MQKKNRVYLPIEKSDILKKVLFEGLSVPEVCKLYHINPRTVHKWKRQLIKCMPSVFEIGYLERKVVLLESENNRLMDRLKSKTADLKLENIKLKEDPNNANHIEETDWDELLGFKD
jgi:transposase-like protein